jgi:hypothetical protein
LTLSTVVIRKDSFRESFCRLLNDIIELSLKIASVFMINKNKFFHDRIILLLLSFNVLVSLSAGLVILLKLINLPSGYYPFVQGRFPSGQKIYSTGSITSLYSLVLFILFILLFNSFLSYKTYPYKKNFSITVLSLSLLLVALTFLVSQSLTSFS